MALQHIVAMLNLQGTDLDGNIAFKTINQLINTSNQLTSSFQIINKRDLMIFISYLMEEIITTDLLRVANLLSTKYII